MDINIKEGNSTRKFAPVDKLHINTTNNQESTWVPADKTKTGVLHASENGIYIASEDGYEAYSEVIVRVTKDSFEGDTNFDDWDYETPDMDLSNWDPETIEEFENDPEAFDDVFNNEDEWKDIDKPIDIKMDNPKIQDTKISGIDPVTGNEMEVGLDEDGYLTESTIPSSIKIEVPPDKHQYVDGQPILFRGMVVKAYTADGELWTDESHPDGVISHSELTFPVTYANISEASGDKYASGDIDVGVEQPIVFRDGSAEIYHHVGSEEEYDKTEITGNCSFVGFSYKSNYEAGKVIAASKEPTTAHYVTYSGDTILYQGDFELNYSSYNGKPVYHSYQQTSTYAVYTSPDLGPFDTEPRIDEVKIAYLILYGNITGGGQTIPVQYIRSDGEVLEDSFMIEVLPDPDGAHPTRTDAIEYNGAYYQADENLNAEAHYASGTVWVRGKGAIYNTRDAVALGLLKPVED